MWIVGLELSGLGTILGSVKMITTIITLRAPGMTMFRMPIFTWIILITALMAIVVFPLLAALLLALAADRKLGAHVFDASHGGPVLYQHLFWFFGHPEVYIVALPFFGIVTEVIPVFSRKPSRMWRFPHGPLALADRQAQRILGRRCSDGSGRVRRRPRRVLWPAECRLRCRSDRGGDSARRRARRALAPTRCGTWARSGRSA
jgi:hypothetical protein